MAETYFKHANIFPAPLPEASATVNLSDQHRQAMRARLYGLRRESKKNPIGPHGVSDPCSLPSSVEKVLLDNEVFKEPYADEIAAPWMSITTSDYQPKKFSEIDLNPNQGLSAFRDGHVRWTIPYE